MNRVNYFLILILSLAFCLRVYNLGQNPVSLYMDEASVGYDAFSVATSGRDQWEESWPLVFKSFGEYKYPWQIYGALASGTILGWSEFSIRLPSAIIGTLNILILYFIAKLITGRKSIGLLSALFLAVSPWHIQFTRMAWETAYVLFFLYLGLYFVLKGLLKKSYWLVVGFISLGFSLFAYNGAKVVTPLLIFWTLSIYRKELKNKSKWIISGLVLFAVFILVNFVVGDLSGFSRYQQVVIDEGIVRQTVVFKFTSNYWLGLIEVWGKQYLSHFTPQFLLISGDANPRHSIQIVGQLLWVEVIFIIFALRRIITKKEKWLIWILGWILISPIPAAVTRETPHALRSILGVGAWQIMAAVGLDYVIQIIKNYKHRQFLYFGIATLVVINVIYFGYGYFKIYPSRYSGAWQYGYSQIFDKKYEYSKYDSVVVSDQYGNPYIFMAWRYKLTPDEFQNNIIYNDTKRGITSVVRRIGNIYFDRVDFYNLPKGKLLIFAHPNEKLTEITEKEKINNPDGTVAFYVYEYENK